MKNLLFFMLLLSSAFTMAQTNLESWHFAQNYRDPNQPTVWQGEVSRGNKPAVAAKIERLDDMGYRLTIDGEAYEFPFTSKIDSRECPVVTVDGKEFTITAFHIKGAELQLRIDYVNGDFVPVDWVLITRQAIVKHVSQATSK